MECDRSIESSQMFSPSDTNTSAHWGPRLPSPQEPIPPEETLGILVVGTTRDHLGMPPTHRTSASDAPLNDSALRHLSPRRVLVGNTCARMASINLSIPSATNSTVCPMCIAVSTAFPLVPSTTFSLCRRLPTISSGLWYGSPMREIELQIHHTRILALGFPPRRWTESYPREATATPPVSSRQWNASNLPRRPRREARSIRSGRRLWLVLVASSAASRFVLFSLCFTSEARGSRKNQALVTSFLSDYLSKTQGRTERSSALSSHTHTAKVRTPFLPTVAITLSKRWAPNLLPNL